MFRRRRRSDDEQYDESLAERDDDASYAAAGESGELPASPDATANTVADPLAGGGPWDSADAPDDDVQRLDLGSMRVPVPEGLEVQIEVQDDVVVAATVLDGDSRMQVLVFAAPKSSGIWHEVRTEIAESLRSSNGSAQESTGRFGTELVARVPEEQGIVPARFIGVDGPRWFVRGLLTGPAATDPQRGRRLEAAFRDIVVHRGGEAMAPRDALPLHMPREAGEVGPPPEAPVHPTLQLQERGPEITEIQ